MRHSELVLPEGDILLHSGDLTLSGNMAELKSAAAWLRKQTTRFKHVVVIAGNHDFALEHFMKEGAEGLAKELFYPSIYLRDTGVTLDGVTCYGSPWQPRFCNWAFNADRGADIKTYWNAIPKNLDVLLTHGPPYHVLDWVGKARVGCDDLRNALDRVQPKVHVFGHIHAAHGKAQTFAVGGATTQCYNAAVVGEDYKLDPKHHPWVLDYDGKTFTEVPGIYETYGEDGIEPRGCAANGLADPATGAERQPRTPRSQPSTENGQRRP
jgi:Icc-related predicted phosphoesterase